MINREASFAPPRSRYGKAKESVVLLEGTLCGRCAFLDGMPCKRNDAEPTNNGRLEWCTHKLLLDSNRWREPTWPACWHFKEVRS